MEKEVDGIKDVNPTLKFLLSNNTIVNVILLVSFIGFLILTIISAINGWWSGEIIINMMLMIIGSFLGAGLLKYGLKK